MRFVLIAALAVSVVGCTRWSMDHHLNNAYRAYDRGNCESVMLELSQVDRDSRARRYIQPEVSMLRGQCLERQKLFVDAAQTYQFIITQSPPASTRFAPGLAWIPCNSWGTTRQMAPLKFVARRCKRDSLGGGVIAPRA